MTVQSMKASVRFPRPEPARADAYYASGFWRHDTIHGLIARRAEETPAKTAVCDASGAALSYAQIEDQARRLAGFLARRGIAKGDIVTACLPNWCQAVVVALGVMKLGAVVNPVSPTFGRADIAYVLGKCRSAALILPAAFRSTDYTRMLTDMARDGVVPATVVWLGGADQAVGIGYDDALSGPATDSTGLTGSDDPVAVLFTSGTESKPKGAVHTHNTILFGERAFADALALGPDDIAFMASPVSHTTGFMHGIVMSLMTGGTLSLLDVFNGPAAVAQMAAHRCTWTMGATPFLGDAVETLLQSEARLPALRYFLCGGAPIPQALVQRAASGGVKVLSVYGSTESPPHTLVRPDDPVENAWSTDGRPLPGIEVKIAGPDGHDLPPHAAGEEWSRGPNTFIGYFDDPELTRKDLDADGWYHSGDLAHRLEDGSIRIIGRLKDVIVRGGQNISAREIEEHLNAHPAVSTVAVVAVPHPRLGETVGAVVVARPGASVSLGELGSFLRDRGLAKFKCPERLAVWPSLPTTPSGKIQKFLIRERLAREHAALEVTS
jgi:acyl-CoA synthetase